MLEYGLISATVVMSFALASQVGVIKSVADRLSSNVDTWNIRLPETISPSAIHDSAQKFNDQIKIR